MGSKAFESPLVSHARMRALYRSLVEVRELGQASQGRGLPKGTEACWVGSALEMRDGDLSSAAGYEWLVAHLRRAQIREGAAASAAEMRRTKTRLSNAEDGDDLETEERLLCAVGQAMALRTLGKGVTVAYAMDGTLKTKGWRRVFETANVKPLPLLVIAMAGGADLSAAAADAGGAKIPVIPVDAGDTLAIYRVAQESIGRARTDGGVAVIECVAMGRIRCR